ncbi:MAG: alpha-L-fucosidase [Planctomycetes bacterium]|nr:alpha-L-fucosidase [Planctomycetota bacterium]
MTRSHHPPVLPTLAQRAWADAEVGVIIHLDMQVFEPGYDFRRAWGYTPPAARFNPDRLDTDRWIETARGAGATYAILVAKHCSGFSLWPTQAHDYSVASSPWRGGRGDVVADFLASCRRFGVKPGIYASASCNAHFLVDNPGRVLDPDPNFLRDYSANIDWQSGKHARWAGPDAQARYNRVVETQLAELWGNYGPLFEIWFDGGVLSPEEGGPVIVPLMQRLQPDAVVFGGPPGWPSLARFVGNERGDPPDPFWSTTDDLRAFDGMTEFAGLGGSPEGRVWSCGEADMPNRNAAQAFQGGWFWRAGDERFLLSADRLTESWFRSVGGNCNLLLGMVIDPHGEVPEADRIRFAEFGERIKHITADPVARVSMRGPIIDLPLGRAGATVLEIMEDIAFGERVRSFVVESEGPAGWIPIWRGTSVGHRRLERCPALPAGRLRLRILACDGEPVIRSFATYRADAALLPGAVDAAKRNPPTVTRGADGLVRIACRNPHLELRYALGGQPAGPDTQLYTGPFPLPQGGVVSAVSCVNHAWVSPPVQAVFGIDRRGWRVVATSLVSPFANNGRAHPDHLLNDDPSWYWHTYHTDTSLSRPPHWVVLDMGAKLEVTAFTLLPRDADGAPTGYRFELSDDNTVWHMAAEGGIQGLPDDVGMRLIPLSKPQAGRYLRFTATGSFEEVPYVVVAGIGVVPA